MRYCHRVSYDRFARNRESNRLCNKHENKSTRKHTSLARDVPACSAERCCDPICSHVSSTYYSIIYTMFTSIVNLFCLKCEHIYTNTWDDNTAAAVAAAAALAGDAYAPSDNLLCSEWTRAHARFGLYSCVSVRCDQYQTPQPKKTAASYIMLHMREQRMHTFTHDNLVSLRALVLAVRRCTKAFRGGVHLVFYIWRRLVCAHGAGVLIFLARARAQTHPHIAKRSMHKIICTRERCRCFLRRLIYARRKRANVRFYFVSSRRERPACAHRRVHRRCEP